jgi:hypothetical protein
MSSDLVGSGILNPRRNSRNNLDHSHLLRKKLEKVQIKLNDLKVKD